jgi:hypothetical protein
MHDLHGRGGVDSSDKGAGPRAAGAPGVDGFALAPLGEMIVEVLARAAQQLAHNRVRGLRIWGL